MGIISHAAYLLSIWDWADAELGPGSKLTAGEAVRDRPFLYSMAACFSGIDLEDGCSAVRRQAKHEHRYKRLVFDHQNHSGLS